MRSEEGSPGYLDIAIQFGHVCEMSNGICSMGSGLMGLEACEERYGSERYLERNMTAQWKPPE